MIGLTKEAPAQPSQAPNTPQPERAPQPQPQGSPAVRRVGDERRVQPTAPRRTGGI